LKRLNIFAKGNLDVRDSLHSLRMDGELRWNGINQALKMNGIAVTARVRHETSLGAEATIASTGIVPAVFDGHDIPLGAYPLATQFGRKIFEASPDVFVLSIQPDIQLTNARHGQERFLFYPDGMDRWQAVQRDWLKREFHPEPLICAGAAMDHMEKLIGCLRATNDVPILVYNMSSVVRGETLHRHAGQEDILSTRIKRFNLALVELSQRSGISIVDVDRLVAQGGAETMKMDTNHLTERGCHAVANEVIHILQDHGCIAPGEGMG